MDCPSLATFKNSSIGSLAVDLSNGFDLEEAVRRYEAKVAPQNYKRSSKLVTQSMITNASMEVNKLGLESALPRRHANLDDITINNLLWANRDVTETLTGDNPFDLITAKSSPVSAKSLTKISMDDFIKDVLPNTQELQLGVTNNLTGNFMSLVAPVNEDVNPLFQWDNNFSWAYINDVTDSIKEKVKAAGGKVDGALRISLSWYNGDDLDLHLDLPTGEKIYYNNKYRSRGRLDVDMNAGGVVNSVDPVENIYWHSARDIPTGHFEVRVNNFYKRRYENVGFEIEIECDGQVYNFVHENDLADKNTTSVCTFNYDQKDGFKLIKSNLPSTTKSKDMWGITTNSMIDVKAVVLSPNHWDDNEAGNKHFFFLLKDCINPDPVRGFYNEFLKDDLYKHRKVFEILGSKMKARPTTEQLSGVGFSETKPVSFLLTADGRPYKVTIAQ